jgi:hypothetical protein
LEQAVIDADSGDGIQTLADVLPADDYDGDGVSNEQEFILGTDLTFADAGGLDISAQGNAVTLEIETRLIAGQAYTLYTNRLYTIQHVPLMLPDGNWTNLPGMTFPATGATVTMTNTQPAAQGYYRYKVDLEKIQ